jgi:hypothetical protein
VLIWREQQNEGSHDMARAPEIRKEYFLKLKAAGGPSIKEIAKELKVDPSKLYDIYRRQTSLPPEKVQELRVFRKSLNLNLLDEQFDESIFESLRAPGPQGFLDTLVENLDSLSTEEKDFTISVATLFELLAKGDLYFLITADQFPIELNVDKAGFDQNLIIKAAMRGAHIIYITPSPETPADVHDPLRASLRKTNRCVDVREHVTSIRQRLKDDPEAAQRILCITTWPCLYFVPGLKFCCLKSSSLDDGYAGSIGYKYFADHIMHSPLARSSVLGMQTEIRRILGTLRDSETVSDSERAAVADLYNKVFE